MTKTGIGTMTKTGIGAWILGGLVTGGGALAAGCGAEFSCVDDRSCSSGSPATGSLGSPSGDGGRHDADSASPDADDAPDAAAASDATLEGTADAAVTTNDAGLTLDGFECSAGADCESGYCVDGVCCDSECGETCARCDIEGEEGTCAPVPVGEDPDDECAGTAGGICSGACDGELGCEVPPPGTACGSPTCQDGVETRFTCSEGGDCVSSDFGCGSYECAENECGTTCVVDEECSSESYCDGGECAARLGSGQLCDRVGACATGFCVDGVCCDSSCGGSCARCDVAGKLGTCSAVPNGTDPDGECGGTGGVGGPCAGRCDGAFACVFPGGSSSCGDPVCSSGVVSTKQCDGAGSCRTDAASCGQYACGGSACRSSCSSDAHCMPSAYCAGSSCKAKKSNGSSCTGGNECTSGNCVDGSCCASSACDANESCSTGECRCGGKVCGGAQACALYFRDADSDGYGAPGETKPVCAGDPEPGYVANDDDCYDGNSDAHPGTSTFFTVHRGDGSYDYDCDGSEEKEYSSVAGLSCKDCGAKAISCITCPGLGGGTYAYTCVGAVGCSGKAIDRGFKSTVSCGQTATLWGCAKTQCSTNEWQEPWTQGCH